MVYRVFSFLPTHKQNTLTFLIRNIQYIQLTKYTDCKLNLQTEKMRQIDENIRETIEQLSDTGNSRWVYQAPTHGQPMPSAEKLREIVQLCRQIIFPGFYGHSSMTPDRLQYYIGVYVDRLFDEMQEQIKRGFCFACERQKDFSCTNCSDLATQVTNKFIASLPKLRQMLINDVKEAFDGDPAAKSHGEIIFCYPGINAITNYRIAHQLLLLGVPLIPRIISEMAHADTGIDIHPGAQIGEYFSIDHGTGVVIGETCIIGNHVKIYQSVTLGAKSFPIDENGNPIKGIARHPIVEDNVVVYSGATILGRITIGKNSIIGGNVWLTHPLPPNSRVIQSRAKETVYVDGGGI